MRWRGLVRWRRGPSFSLISSAMRSCLVGLWVGWMWLVMAARTARIVTRNDMRSGSRLAVVEASARRPHRAW